MALRKETQEEEISKVCKVAFQTMVMLIALIVGMGFHVSAYVKTYQIGHFKHMHSL